MSWLIEFAAAAEKTDTLARRANHQELLAAGLLGEVGGILAEFKKKQREGPAYPLYQERLEDEVGDTLWYFVRLASAYVPGLLETLPMDAPGEAARARPLLALGAAAGHVLDAVQRGDPGLLRAALKDTWRYLCAVTAAAHVDLNKASGRNRAKISSRWSQERTPHPLFDEDRPAEEQLPRAFTVDFLVRGSQERPQVVLRHGVINIGARITDNISEADAYRFHDIFHFAYAAYLGWSPVLRSLLNCKRKSDSADEKQDGARAAIIEEAISATVFSRAKRLADFEGIEQVDYDLLKSIQEFTRGYEVEKVPVWQWEEAILEGFFAFRQLKAQNGGRVTMSLDTRQLIVEPLR